MPACFTEQALPVKQSTDYSSPHSTLMLQRIHLSFVCLMNLKSESVCQFLQKELLTYYQFLQKNTHKYYAKSNDLTNFVFPNRALNSRKHKFSKQNAKRKKSYTILSLFPHFRMICILSFSHLHLCRKKVTEFYHFSKLFSIKKEMSSFLTNI